MRSIIRWVVMFFFRHIASVQVEGYENLPTQGGYIAASNHLGRLDAALVYYFLDRPDVYLLVAEKYHKYAFVRWLVKVLDAVWVDRFGADIKALRTMLGRLEAGGVLVAAPEGTRSKAGSLLQGRPGVTYLAVKAGVPLVPVGVFGTEDRLVVERLKKLRGPVITVRIGEPFTLPPIKGREREQALAEYTEDLMCRIAALLPPSYRGVYADHPRLRELLDGQVEGG